MAFKSTHLPCPKCGSSDARSVNEDGSSKCFSCNSFFGGTEQQERKPVSGGFVNGKVQSLARRGLTKETCQKWGYHVGRYDGTTVQIANYRAQNGNLIGQKLRFPDKSFKVKGELVGLYGQHIWKDGGRRVVVTEGEVDALSVSQAFDNKWPVVSVPHGAASGKKYVAHSLDWLERYDEVVFMFDMDDAGRNAAAECAALLSPGRAKLAELPLKDPNDMLTANRSKEIVQSVWNARSYRPDGIITADELWDKITEELTEDSKPYPYSALNEKTHGLRRGELVTICAGSGIGKSLLCREVCYNLLQSGETVGYIALEESVRRTALGILGVHLSRPLHLEKDLDFSELEEPFRDTIGNGNFYTYDHWGSCDSDNLLAKVRYLCRGMGCNWIFLDHLSIVVSGFEGDDERRLIDNTMTRLRGLVEETKCGMVLVSHLKRPHGAGHEEGAVTSLAHLRGSAAIAQLSDIVLGMERNQQAVEDANQTRLRVLKNRFSGETGLAGTLYFNNKTGRLHEKDNTVFQVDLEAANDNDVPF